MILESAALGVPWNPASERSTLIILWARAIFISDVVLDKWEGEDLGPFFSGGEK